MKSATTKRHRQESWLARGATLLILALGIAFSNPANAVPEIHPEKEVSPGPGTPWTPPANVPTGLPPSADTAAETEDAGKAFTLAELIDAALQNNPSARIAWAQALATAAQWGQARSAYYPTVTGNSQAVAGKIPVMMGGSSYALVGAGLSYLLVDFGGRHAAAEAARQALIAANFSHNQAISDVLRNVPQAYYTLTAKRAQVRASERALAEARESLSAARMRLDAGAGTMADVLQAQAAEAQAVLNLASDRGAAEIARGNLATSVGWPAHRRFEVAPEPEALPLRSLASNVDALVERARRDRADLNAAIAAAHQREQQLKQARAMPFPQLTVGGQLQYQVTRSLRDYANYGTVQLSLPIFDGFNMQSAVRSARAQLEAARASLKAQELNVISEVFTSHQNFRTAKEQVTASRALYASAEESFAASLARYRGGAANIVELLNAQSTLSSARSQLIGSRMNLSISYAELLHAVGSELKPDGNDSMSMSAATPPQGGRSDVNP